MCARRPTSRAPHPGIADVRPYTKEESAQLLEPWLGTGLVLDDLPIPRLIVVRLASGATPDFAALRKALAAQVPGASSTIIARWIDRMRTMADTAVAGGLGMLALVLAATVLSVIFATRGAMATNRPIVEVLHFIGAKDGFIAGQFQRHFLLLGLKGGAIGGGAAIVLFGLIQVAGKWLAGTRGRRRGGGPVRQPLDRARRLYRGARPDRADGAGDGLDLAADRQPYARWHRIGEPQCHRTVEFGAMI